MSSRDFVALGLQPRVERQSLSGLTRGGWAIFSVLLGMVLLVVLTTLGIIVSVGGQDLCSPAPTEQGKDFLQVTGSSLFPYMGQATLESKGHPVVDECLAICLHDKDCLALYHHTQNDVPERQGDCFFYHANNAVATVGKDIALSPFFDTSALVVGPQLPNSATNVYIKNGQGYQELSGGMLQPKL